MKNTLLPEHYKCTGLSEPLARNSLLSLFDEVVDQTPDSIAASCETECITYQQLNRIAESICRWLSEHGIGPEIPVGLTAKRGIGVLAALLGILKAGGAYLPLDPALPAKRFSRLLERGGPKVILGDEEGLSALERCGARIPFFSIEKLFDGPGPPSVTPTSWDANLAYMLFTSGSTGEPKAVGVHIAGMRNHLMAKIADLELTSADVIAQTAPLTFDISVWQMLAGALVGGCVRIIPNEVTADPALLLDHAAQSRITVLEVVPSSLCTALRDSHLDASSRSDLSSLKWMVVTGEELPPRLCSKWFELYQGIPMLNAYGPTECSDDVAHWPIFNTHLHGTVRIPIGRPLPNTRLYVLDAELNQVEVGAPGELFVSGICVGRGYLGQPDKTASTFLPDLLSWGVGARMYRTGDRARELTDGSLEFLGRVDQQIKIHGFRIEPGEIEAALMTDPALLDVVVIAVPEAGGDKRLAAFMIASPGVAADIGRVKTALTSKLPHYAVPHDFFVVDAFPQTDNGKVDRKRLAEVATTRVMPSMHPTAPSNKLERQLSLIWKDVLSLDQVGVLDNIFELGANSLRLAEISHKIRKHIKQDISVVDLFEYQTIRSLAQFIAGPEPHACHREEFIPFSTCRWAQNS